MIEELNKDLTLFNNYRIKSICKRALFPEKEIDFVKIFRESDSPKVVLGGGYNIILSKEYYKEDFLLIGKTFAKVKVEDNLIEAEAGVDMKSLSEVALANHLSGSGDIL